MSINLRQPEEIFLAVSKAPPDEWNARVEQACAGNDTVRRRVLELLNAHGRSDFLEDLSVALEGTVGADCAGMQSLGDTIDNYRLMEQIGEGGMGVVFVAEQQKPVRRKVALKVIKPGMDTKDVVARFAAEKQALALMDHPHIAKVFDAGETDTGRPYFVMELVRGIPITEYCDQAKLTVRERLELFICVCHAVQHAHQKGIIHRDVKPTNVLVTLHDGRPVPKVIDFGVAKAINQQLTERTIYTKFAQMVGTPMYMSPEQAELSALDVDTRSDIYSLGVLLYELLTGSTPFDKQRLLEAAHNEMRRIIREEEPPKPSTQISTLGEKATHISTQRRINARKLWQMLNGDLDWIVMTAIEKDRTRRYDSANGLALDVQRYLDNDPVIARPPSSVYRVRKFVRRHKMHVAATLAVSVALLAGLVGTSIAARQAREAEATAAIAAQQAQEAEKQARADVQSLYEEFLDRAVNAAVIGDLAQASEAIDKAEVAGAPQRSLKALEGIALFLSGRIPTAIRFLEDSLERDSQNLNAKAVLYWAYFNSFQFAELFASAKDLGPIVTGSSLNAQLRQSEVARVFAALPLICFDNGRELDQVLQTLNDIIKKHDRWGIAKSIRSIAWVKHGALTENLEYMHLALEDHKGAQSLIPDSAYVDANGLLLCVTSIRLAKAQRRDFHVWKAEAEELLPKLSKRSSSLTNATQLAYLRATDQFEQAEQLEMELLEVAEGNLWIRGAMLFEQRRHDELVELMTASRQLSGSRQMLACALAEDSKSGPDKAMQVYWEWFEEKKDDPWTRTHILDILLYLGKEREVAIECERILEHEQELFHYWDRYTLRYLLGEIEESEYLRKARPFYYYDASAHYWVGLKALAAGKKRKAKHFFAKIRDTGAFGYPDYHWGGAFHARLEQDPNWPEWIPTSSESEAPQSRVE